MLFVYLTLAKDWGKSLLVVKIFEKQLSMSEKQSQHENKEVLEPLIDIILDIQYSDLIQYCSRIPRLIVGKEKLDHVF